MVNNNKTEKGIQSTSAFEWQNITYFKNCSHFHSITAENAALKYGDLLLFSVIHHIKLLCSV